MIVARGNYLFDMWQVLFLLYFVFGATNYLLRRVLAQQLGDHNLLINAIFFVFFLLPATIVLSFFFPHNLNVGALNLSLLFGGSVIWPILNIVSFRANKDVDVGIFTVINNISPLFTLLIALPFLNEKLKMLQILGVGLLLFSGVLAAASQLKKHHRASINGLLFCLLSAVICGVAIAYEGFMLNRIDFGAYLIYGWGAQIVWGALLAYKEWHKLPKLFARKAARQTVLMWGATDILKSVAFILALKINGSASIISAASDFMSVAVIIAAYFYLRERQHMVYKWLATIVGILGLLFIAR